MDLSVVVPLFNEAENIRPLVAALRAAIPTELAWELVLVDDGSEDDTVSIAQELGTADPRIRVLQLARNFGQTPAMQAGFDHARGRIVVSMDGDLQNDPLDIPRLLEKLEEGYDLVAGYRVRRQDHQLTRKLPSWLANRLIRRVTGVSIRDNGCSLKAYRRTLLDQIHLYSDMHRFIPAVAAAATGARIAEIPVRHHARRFGKSKYGLDRILKVLGDLFVIKMIRSFPERPLLMFSGAALVAMALALLFAGASAVSMLLFQPQKANSLVLPGAALLWTGLACYLAMLGLIAEVAVSIHRRPDAPVLTLPHENRG